MPKFIIEIHENTDIAKNILKGWQYIMYKQALGILMGIIYKAVKKFEEKKEGNKRIFTEEGDQEYVELEKKKFENFMFSEESELNKDKFRKYKNTVNNRWLQKVIRQAHKYKKTIPSKAIRAALGGSDVFSFFAKLGVYIKWEIK